ncbi:hypothetical protein KIH74_22590 [Kineosporia sp. J2-2]|uniref:HD domain-containing protein n=1 Tax=Kineosporia corallincola TaxID=2835133 RepID=A0ABS5TNG8_9ACTN|nr:hypothetical protein [Kineosporia corallincola]MBT0771746.1 hypothetical protein [Kineosporia corallincola]
MDNDDALSEIAWNLAARAHHGQLDKQGRGYFDNHLCPVAALLRPYGAYVEAAGYLHDILEDTATRVGDLRRAGIPYEVTRAVIAVTRRPGEEYTDLIERARLDPIGRLVKLADNWVNLTGLAGIEDEATRERLRRKYVAARERLEFK